MPTPADLTVLAGFIAGIVTVIMQYIKPFIEDIPGITLPSNRLQHDNLLRIVQYLLNLALLVASSRTPALAPLFVGLTWYGYALVAAGQFGFAHIVYSLNSRGGATSNQSPVWRPLQVSASFNSAPDAVTSSTVTTDFPTVPKE